MVSQGPAVGSAWAAGSNVVHAAAMVILLQQCVGKTLLTFRPTVQLHVLDGGKTVHIYSRNAEDMTPRYPDIVSRLPSWLAPGTKSIVIDGEAVAWDPDKGRILPFQVMQAGSSSLDLS
jgi:hypothetical protein